jgi:hypothetical protein
VWRGKEHQQHTHNKTIKIKGAPTPASDDFYASSMTQSDDARASIIIE